MMEIRSSPFAIRHFSTRQRGSALVFSLFILFFMGTMMTAALSLFAAQVEAMSREHSRIVALHLAEGGVDWAIAHLRQSAMSGATNRTPIVASEYRGDTNVALGDGTFDVSVSHKGNGVVIVSRGRVSGLRRYASVWRGPVTRTIKVQGRLIGRGFVVDLWQEGASGEVMTTP